jgi:serine/threonine protein kinase
MNAEKWKKVEAIFESAIERDPAERAAYLDEACGRDSALRREVESLLAHQQPTGRFMPTLVQEAAKIVAREGSIAPGDSRFIPGTVLAGRYRLVGPLGKGGMGEVYRADDLKLSQVVALKFLPVSLEKDRAMLERFHREVRIARQISHPNICRVYDIGEVDGQHFLSMEYVDGEDLASLLRRIGRLPSDKAVEIAGQLCAGLAAAHEQGVLHRDLKPANVMIDGRGKARIMDFGLAGLADEFEGQEVRAGTPAYMAPEQLAGREVTERSDIYSLGLVLYEIFTGKKAFEASSLEELIRQHESSTPPSISDYVKEIDPLVERVILRCLERGGDCGRRDAFARDGGCRAERRRAQARRRRRVSHRNARIAWLDCGAIRQDDDAKQYRHDEIARSACRARRHYSGWPGVWQFTRRYRIRAGAETRHLG